MRHGWFRLIFVYNKITHSWIRSHSFIITEIRQTYIIRLFMISRTAFVKISWSIFECFSCAKLVHQSWPSVGMLLRRRRRFVWLSGFPVIMNNVIWLFGKFGFFVLWCKACFEWIRWRLVLCDSVGTMRIHVFLLELLRRLKQYLWSMFRGFSIATITFPPVFVQILIFWQFIYMNTYSSITEFFLIGFKKFFLSSIL